MSIIQKSIGKLLSDVVKANSDRDALVHTEIGNRYNYENLSQELDRAARGFLSRGIKPGDKIALWSPTVPGIDRNSCPGTAAGGKTSQIL